MKARSNGEKHLMVTLDHKKVKRKGVSNGENLLEAPKDERLDNLPEHYKEKSVILIEPSIPVNVGIEQTPRLVHLPTSLSERES